MVEYLATDIDVALWIEIYVFVFFVYSCYKRSMQCELSHIAPIFSFLLQFNVYLFFFFFPRPSLIPVNDDNW